MPIDPVISRWFTRAFEFLRSSQTLTSNTTQAGTAADTNETDLWSYTMPANTLNANGKGVRVTVWGNTGANANSKTFKCYFGATSGTFGPGAYNTQGFVFQFVIVRTGASAQLMYMNGAVSASSPGIAASLAPAEDTSGAVIIKFTGTNGTASANDIVFRGAIVELLN